MDEFNERRHVSCVLAKLDNLQMLEDDGIIEKDWWIDPLISETDEGECRIDSLARIGNWMVVDLEMETC